MRAVLKHTAKWAIVGGITLSLCHCGGGSGSNTGTSSDANTSSSRTASNSNTSGSTASTTTGTTTSSSSTTSDNTSSNTGDSTSDTTHTQTDPAVIGLTALDWDVVSDGEGSVTFDADGILMTPKVATTSGETHGAWLLAKTTEATPLQNFKATITYTTVSQLRTGTAPNPWEVFWLFFNYTTDSNGKKQTNYVMIKTNGTEMDRAYDEADQEFLVTNSAPTLQIGSAHTMTVTKSGTHVTVLLDDQPAADFTSEASPSAKYIYDIPGAIGLYTEDAQVRVSSVKVESL